MKDLDSIPGRRSGGRDITIRRFEIRRQILAVAKHRFARFGYAQVPLQDVAAAAGMDWGDFLMYFQDKERLLTAILEEGWKELLPRLDAITSSATTAHSAIITLFSFMTNLMQKDEDLVRLLLSEGRRPNPEMGGLGLTRGYSRFMEICRDQVVRGQRDGSFARTHHPQVTASMLVGAFEGMLRDRLIAEQERSVTGYTSSYLLTACDALVSSLKN